MSAARDVENADHPDHTAFQLGFEKGLAEGKAEGRRQAFVDAADEVARRMPPAIRDYVATINSQWEWLRAEAERGADA